MATVTDFSSGATAYGVSSSPNALAYQEKYLTEGGQDFWATLHEGLGTNQYKSEREDYISAIDRMYNAEQAQKSRDWQEYMSNTAYQRAVADMKRAGINPIMAFQQGGASTPSGSAGSSSSSRSGASAEYSTILAGLIADVAVALITRQPRFKVGF